MAVRQPEVLPDIESQNSCGVVRFDGSSLDSAACPHFSGCYIECTGAVAELLHFQEGPANRQLNVVRVGKNCQDVYCTHIDKCSIQIIYRDKPMLGILNRRENAVRRTRLPLTTEFGLNVTMKLTVLGSGTSEPHPERSSSGYWLESGSGSVLLDCSASSLHRMAQERLDWANLDAIWISHFHLDHCGGLAPFLFATKHAFATHERRKPMRIYGAAGLQELLETFDSANNYKLFEQPFPLEIIEIENLEKFRILPDVEATPWSTPHTDDSYAIHFRDRDGKTLVYTADTGYSEVLATFARRVDLLLMECSFPYNKTVKIHLELAEAIQIVRRAEPRKTVLTHLYAQWDNVDFDEEVSKFSPIGEVIEARDGLKIEI